MSILTGQPLFSGTPENLDVLHIVDVSDTTDHPSGSSFKIEYGKIKDDINYLWTSGSTGMYSIKAKNDSPIDATGDYSHAEGYNTFANGDYSHAEGLSTTAIGSISHSEGQATTAIGEASHSEGWGTTSSGEASHSEGGNTLAGGSYSHAEGVFTTASGLQSHAEGNNTTAVGSNSHAEGVNTISSNYASHAEGVNTISSNYASHAEGQATTANGANSHSEGLNTTATGANAHAEGDNTAATGANSHAGGQGNITKKVMAAGSLAFAHYRAESTTKNSGVSSIYSAILGGVDNYLPSGVNNSVILGGSGITGSTDNTVYVPNLFINDIQSFADDAAAGVGGLVAGMVYQTNGSGASPLNVAGILMIKQ